MPIYEFQCQACGVEIEVLQKINDPHITNCEACGKAEMKKKVTAAAFRLSGAGWYETDFKKDGDNKKNLTEGSSSKESGSKPENKDQSTSSKDSEKTKDTKSSESTSTKSDSIIKETGKSTKSKEKSPD